jgi:hypothetical protein
VAASAARQQSIEGANVEEIPPLRLFHQRAQALGMEGPGSIEQRAGQRGDRDPIDDRAVIGVDRSHPVEADPLDSTPRVPGRRDVDGTARNLLQIPQRRRSRTAQQSALPAGQDGGHPPPARGEATVTNGVDPTLNTDQVTAPDCPRNRRGR